MVNNENIELVETEEYKEFVDKFKIKLTTDDCYTPDGVYKVVRDFAMAQYGFDEGKIIRPFCRARIMKAFTTRRDAWYSITHLFPSLQES